MKYTLDTCTESMEAPLPTVLNINFHCLKIHSSKLGRVNYISTAINLATHYHLLINNSKLNSAAIRNFIFTLYSAHNLTINFWVVASMILQSEHTFLCCFLKIAFFPDNGVFSYVQFSYGFVHEPEQREVDENHSPNKLPCRISLYTELDCFFYRLSLSCLSIV